MFDAPSISVIVPTRGDRRDQLERQAAAVEPQLQPGDQLLLSLDGKNPEPWLAALASDIITGDPVGPAGTRNRALRQATGDIILFLNDDVIPEPDLLDRHRAAHVGRDTPSIVVGDAPWATPDDDTPLDRMLRETSLIFFYDQMRISSADHNWGFRHAWTLNLSLPRSICAVFDQRLSHPMFDDLEWAFRVCRTSGAPVLFESSARVTHEHRYTPEDVLAREVLMGHQSAALRTINPAAYAAAILQPDINTPPTEGELAAAATGFQNFADWCRRGDISPSDALNRARSWRHTARRFGAASADRPFDDVKLDALAWANPPAAPLQRSA